MNSLVDIGDVLFSVCYIDFVKFKEINDKYGHEVGNIYLKEFAKLMNFHRLNCYRIGGDEFIVLLKNHEINYVSKTLSVINSTNIIVEKNGLKIRFNYGISCFKNDANSYEELINIADKRMYKKKGVDI